jgi:hypothetical protein
MDSYSPAVLVIIITLAALIYFLHLQDRKWTGQWKDLAKIHGMEVTPGSWSTPGSAKGNYRERRLKLKTYSHDETNYNRSAYALSTKKTWYTHVALSVDNQPNRDMTLWKKGFADRACKSFGDRIGDERFDNTFIAHGNPEGFLANVLNSPELRKTILKAHWPRGATLMLRNKHLTFEMKAREVDIRGVISLFDLLCDVAEAVEAV